MLLDYVKPFDGHSNSHVAFLYLILPLNSTSHELSKLLGVFLWKTQTFQIDIILNTFWALYY